MMRKRLIRRGLQQQHVFLSTELVLSVPILGIVLLGLLEFSLLIHASCAVQEAARQGARMAVLPGATVDDVCHEVQLALGTRLDYEADVAITQPPQGSEEVAVMVRVPMAAASPNFLRPVGIDLERHSLYCETLAFCR